MKIPYCGIYWSTSLKLVSSNENCLILVTYVIYVHSSASHVLELIGANTMSYCSVLLRSIMASLLAHWETSRDKLAAHSSQHLRTTVMLLRCMALVCVCCFCDSSL
jgi:hypothetical protein